MPNLTSPFKSKRVRDVSPELDEPTPFQVVGGWSDATPPGLLEEDRPSERELRSAGATALAALASQRLQDQKAAQERNLGNAPRGIDWSTGARFRD